MPMAEAQISTRALRPAPLAGRQRRGASCVHQWVNETLDSSVCARNSRTKHNMVKDAEVGKPLHSGEKKKNNAITERCSLLIFFWVICFKCIPLVFAPDSYSAMNFGQLPGRIGMNGAFTQAWGMGKLLVSLPRVPGCIRPTAVQDSPSPTGKYPLCLRRRSSALSFWNGI